MAIKPKNMAIVSEALERLQKATTREIVKYTGMERLKVTQALSSLVMNHYIEKGEFTGRGNENYWVFLKPYSVPKSSEKDWSEHYAIFRQMVLHGRIEETI